MSLSSTAFGRADFQVCVCTFGRSYCAYLDCVCTVSFSGSSSSTGDESGEKEEEGIMKEDDKEET